MYRSSWVALVAAMGALAPSYAFAQAAPPRLELQVGGGENASVSGGVFVPFMLPDGQVLFADGWLDYQDGGAVYGSIGGGYRQQVGDWVLGVNGALEFATSPYGFNYQQISAGLEALSTQFEFRLNGHAPIGTTSNEVDALSKAKISNGAFVINQGYEVALYGLEAEAGIRLPVFPEDSPNALKLYAGAYVQGSERTETVAGVSLRTELTLSLDQMLPGATLGLGGGMRYDSNNELSGSVHVRFSAPIGGAPTAVQAASPLYQRVERNRSIATTAGSFGSDVAAFADSGSGKVIQVSAADGKAKDLNAMIAAAGDGAIILASGRIVVDETLVLASNQMLVGGGGVVNLTTADGKKVGYLNTGAATSLDATPQSSPAAFAAPLKVDGIRLADGTTVSTVSIVGAENGIVAQDVNNVTIDNVSISGVTGNGIVLNRVSGATITNSEIKDTYICQDNTKCEFSIFNPSYVPNAAINAVGVQNLSISNLDISDVTYGIFIAPEIDDSGWPTVVTSSAENISISNVNITNSRREALMTVGAHDVEIDQLHVNNSGLDRDMDLVVFQTSHNISFTNSSLVGGVNGLMFAYYSGIPGQNPSNISVANVTISDTSRAGIFINPSNNVTFKDVTISNAGSYGVFFYGDNWGFMGGPVRDITFDNVVVESARDGAAYISGPLKNIQGDLQVGAGIKHCDANTGSWTGTDLTQGVGFEFSIGGVPVNATNLPTNCVS
ncbi:hypothetical protein WH87_05865 [Devosia epidermidihirudinis]|uniref:Right handed beta helix domain-containing protein n=1 Tax=Devosia epidermidihirudinis TaxID=1293439 RepID=A0A0F5QI35_9HYPH|nr:inverse autotransporter beta-barrel domain-containing protein [Devosia epidermidihirudinis]KKC39674.1 hypothetical protein WH87_05865 [Devosia epidermidihirudinis]